MTRTSDTASIDYRRVETTLKRHYAGLSAELKGPREDFRLKLEAALTRFGAKMVSELRGEELYDLLDVLGITGVGTPTIQPDERPAEKDDLLS